MTNSVAPGNPPELPRMPTGGDAPSTSELMPFRSTKISLRNSSLLVPLIVTGLVTVALFGILLDPSDDTPFTVKFQEYIFVLSTYILFVIFWAVHAYSSIRTHMWIYLPAAVLTGVFLHTPLWTLLYLLFENVLPGYLRHSKILPVALVGWFFATMREEVVKALPGLIGLLWFLRSRKPGGAEAQTGFGRWFYTSSPTDGVLLGVAAGIGFTFAETMFQYVPDTVATVTKNAGEAGGMLFGLLLALPRILGAVVGHVAYGGISGYFIGLAARYPRKLPLLVLSGIVVATIPHALWDIDVGEGAISTAKSVIVGLASMIMLLFCLLKAKQIYSSEHGGVATNSILVGATGWAGAPVAAAPVAYAPQPVAPAPRPQPVVAPPPAPVAPAPVAPPPAVSASRPATLYALYLGAERCDLSVGQTVDLAAAFPSAGLAAPAKAEVTAHPTDPTIVGLRNLTQATWAIQVETGASASVPPGRNVKLVAGEKIMIGAVTLEVRKL